MPARFTLLHLYFDGLRHQVPTGPDAIVDGDSDKTGDEEWNHKRSIDLSNRVLDSPDRHLNGMVAFTLETHDVVRASAQFDFQWLVWRHGEFFAVKQDSRIPRHGPNRHGIF